jgi:hypothetical protein
VLGGADPIFRSNKHTDNSGRRVARGLHGEIDPAAELTLAGLALAYRQYSSDYIDEEAEAMAARRGLWSGEFQAPWDYRRNPEPAAAQPVRREVSDPCASGGSTKTRPASRKLAVGTCSGYSSVQIALRYKPTSGSEPRRVARQPVAQVIVAHARQRSHAWTW